MVSLGIELAETDIRYHGVLLGGSPNIEGYGLNELAVSRSVIRFFGVLAP